MEPYLIPDRRLTAGGGEGGWQVEEGGEGRRTRRRRRDTGVFFPGVVTGSSHVALARTTQRPR